MTLNSLPKVRGARTWPSRPLRFTRPAHGDDTHATCFPVTTATEVLAIPSSLRTPSPWCTCGGRGAGSLHLRSPLQLRAPAPAAAPGSHPQDDSYDSPSARGQRGASRGVSHTSPLRSEHLPAPNSHSIQRVGLNCRGGRLKTNVLSRKFRFTEKLHKEYGAPIYPPAVSLGSPVVHL